MALCSCFFFLVVWYRMNCADNVKRYRQGTTPASSEDLKCVGLGFNTLNKVCNLYGYLSFFLVLHFINNMTNQQYQKYQEL